jgi:hypothetical protein
MAGARKRPETQLSEPAVRAAKFHLFGQGTVTWYHRSRDNFSMNPAMQRKSKARLEDSSAYFKPNCTRGKPPVFCAVNAEQMTDNEASATA